jgi:hypothetical protein
MGVILSDGTVSTCKAQCGRAARTERLRQARVAGMALGTREGRERRYRAYGSAELSSNWSAKDFVYLYTPKLAQLSRGGEVKR